MQMAKFQKVGESHPRGVKGVDYTKQIPPNQPMLEK
jgi:hypothetical protein